MSCHREQSYFSQMTYAMSFESGGQFHYNVDSLSHLVLTQLPNEVTGKAVFITAISQMRKVRLGIAQ